MKGGVKADDGSEYCHRDSSNDDGVDPGAQPDNKQRRATLDVATDPWGIKVNRVELKNIIPPKAIQDAMEKQMKAERERREAILRAEGEKKSTILVAEGNKESVILDANASRLLIWSTALSGFASFNMRRPSALACWILRIASA